MGSVLHCSECQYNGHIGHAPRGRLYYCGPCESLVTAYFPPHTFKWPNCPKCNNLLSYRRLAEHFVHERPEGGWDFPCPKCGHRYLEQSDNGVHICYLYPDPPAAGDVIHCVAHEGRLILQAQMSCRIRPTTQICAPDETPVEVRVLSVNPNHVGMRFAEGMELKTTLITVEFIRVLDWETL